MLPDYGLLVLAVILLAIGYLAHVGILVTAGWIVLAVGVVLALLALAGRSPFRSRHRRL